MAGANVANAHNCKVMMRGKNAEDLPQNIIVNKIGEKKVW
jgi:hypothetical protein